MVYGRQCVEDCVKRGIIISPEKRRKMMVHEEYTYDTGRKILYKQVLPQTEKSTDGADFIANVYYYYAPKEILEKLGML